MDADGIDAAARMLADAWRGGSPAAALPEGAQPQTFADAAAVQARMLELLGEKIAGYKVVGTTPDDAMWGLVVASRMVSTPASLPATSMPLLGIEAEVAYRLEEDVPADVTTTPEAFSAIATAMPAIEIVATRFADFDAAPVLHRAADFMSNGALVCGEARPGWPSADFSDVALAVTASGRTLADMTPGREPKDVRTPALAFLNSPLRRETVRKGMVITTGSLSGIQFARPGDTVTAAFDGFGTVEVTLSA